MSEAECSFGPVSDEQLAALARRVLQTSFPVNHLATYNDALLKRTTNSVTQRLAQDLGVDPVELSSKSRLVAHEVRSQRDEAV